MFSKNEKEKRGGNRIKKGSTSERGTECDYSVGSDQSVEMLIISLLFSPVLPISTL